MALETRGQSVRQPYQTTWEDQPPKKQLFRALQAGGVDMQSYAVDSVLERLHGLHGSRRPISDRLMH